MTVDPVDLEVASISNTRKLLRELESLSIRDILSSSDELEFRLHKHVKQSILDYIAIAERKGKLIHS